jgi:hypothetical protein
MLPDPVEGLSRRHGSVYRAQVDLALANTYLTEHIADTATWKTFEYTNGGKDYVLCMRRAARPTNSALKAVICYNKTDNVFVPYSRSVTDAILDTFESGGCSAVTAIGRWVFMAGDTMVPTSTSTARWDATANNKDAVIWIRGGAYGRTFKVTAVTDTPTTYNFEYTTPTSSYPEVLDTSSVPVYAKDPAGGTTTEVEGAYVSVANGYTHTLNWGDWSPTALTVAANGVALTNTTPTPPANATEFSWAAAAKTILFHSSNAGVTNLTVSYTHNKTVANPNYANIVGEMTNEYNSAVTNWIGTAAEAIQPQNIAEQLRLAAVTAGLTSGTRYGSTVHWNNVKSLVVSDGGDGTLLRGVANEVTGVEKLSDLHKVGKIVRIRAKDSAETFYMKAQAKEATITSGITEVRWIEGAGVEHDITSAVIYGTIDDGSFCVASTSALMNTLTGLSDTPDFVVSDAGDSDSNPLPYFVGKKITYLGVYQDRLLIGAGAVLRASKTADYLNLFPSSILTVPADDAYEVLSQGADDDTLRHSVLYDRDLVVFGDKRQYVLNGRLPMTPTNASMPVMSSHANTTDAPPIAVGGLIFYGQSGVRASSLHQIQPGQASESPESFINSSQIATYLQGSVVEISKHDKPTHIFMRTTGLRNGVYIFSYLDKQGEGRVQDAWHRFEYAEELGSLIGMSQDVNGLILYWLRTGLKANGTFTTWIVADRQPLTAGLSTVPYLDSIRTEAVVEGGDASRSVHSNTVGEWYAAFDDTTEYFLLGDSLANYIALQAEFPLATGLWIGAWYDSTVALTNPRFLDKNEQSVNIGRLTVGSVTLSLNDSTGCITDVTDDNGTVTTEYNGRVVGDVNNIIGREPITDLSQSVPIARERRKFTLTIKARKWFPLTITAIEWVGQFFNRSQRV